MPIAIEKIETTNIGMGKIGAARAPGLFRAILGSCIGLALYAPRAKAGTLAHIVLPNSSGRSGPPGKFADTAVAEMLRLMKQYEALPGGMVAKMAGGANMFGRGGPIQIGQDNIAAVKSALQTAGIKIVSQETGGTKGRRVLFDCQNGDFEVQIVGQPVKHI